MWCPGIFGFLGSRDAEHQASNHNDCYDVPEEVLKRGAAMHAQFAADYLKCQGTTGKLQMNHQEETI